VSQAGSYTLYREAESIVLLRCSGVLSNEAFQSYLAQFDALLAAARPYALILDLRQVAVPNAVQRKLQADWMRDHEPKLRALCRGGAFVIQSTPIRGVMTAILWLQPMPFDYVVVATIDEAVSWAALRVGVSADNVRLPSGGAVR